MKYTAARRNRGSANVTSEFSHTTSCSLQQQVKGFRQSKIRYYLGSKKAKAKEYARYVRGHWGIENSLHWVLDMVFDEDRNRTRKDHGPENLAWLRRLAVGVLANTKSCSGSIRTKQLHAILDDQVLAKMLSLFRETKMI